MFLREVIDTHKIREISGEFNPNKLGNPIGTGMFAKVYKGKQPGTVIKVADVEDEYDGYLKFVKIAIKNQNNPFFPRIYNAKLYKPRNFDPIDDYFTLVVVMEKLIPITNKNIQDVVKHLAVQLNFPGNIEDLYDVFEDPTERQNLLKLAKKNRNEQFAKALLALETLFQSNEPDMSLENMMVRLTKFGPQLVFTDPVASPNLE